VEAQRGQSMNRLTKWLAVLALVASVGGHWALLQGLAWTTMLARFSQSMPLMQAVTFTFDGKHACTLCDWVATGKKADQDNQEKLLVKKLDLVQQVPSPFLFRQPVSSSSKTVPGLTRVRTEQPPSPPPRFA
jgi:hypothetical protein